MGYTLFILFINAFVSCDERFIEKMLFPREPSSAHVRRHHVRRHVPNSEDSIESYVTSKDLKVTDADIMACLQPKLGCYKIKLFFVLQTEMESDCFQKNLPILFEVKALNKDNVTTSIKVVNGFLPQDNGADADQIALEPGINDNCQKIKR